jgi:hypothetical protein
MTKTIFVVGCSFSHHDIYVKPNETWPFLLQNDLNCRIVNCSVPGNSNLSYFYRLKEAEEQFGKPDKVIVQLTGLQRLFFHIKNVPICDLVKHKKFNYYYDKYNEHCREAGVSVTPAVFTDYNVLNMIKTFYNIRPKDIQIYWKYFASDDSLEWLNLKECMLIDMYFKDTVFFTWNHGFNWLSKYVNYLGDLKHDILGQSKFKEYSHIPLEDEHFNTSGHIAVKEFIKQHV